MLHTRCYSGVVMLLLFSLYRRYARRPCLVLVLLLIAQLSAAVSPLAFGRFIAALGDDGVSTVRLGGLIGLVGALDALSLACQYGSGRAVIRQSASMARSLKDEALRRFMRLDTEQREGSAAGEWERRVSFDTQIAAQSVCSALSEMAGTLISFCFVSLALIWQQPAFLVLIGALALSFMGVYRLNRRRLRESAQEARTTGYEEGTTLIDLIALTPVIRLFRAGGKLAERFARVTKRMEEHSVAVDQSSNAYTTQIRAIMVAGRVVSLLISAGLFALGQLGVGDVVAVMMLVNQISGQMGQLVFVVPMLARGSESAAALEHAFGLVSAHSAPAWPTPPAAAPLPDVPLISLRGVRFAYRNGHCVLNGLDWDIRPGEYHSVLGGNGEGKSTLIRLILGSLQSSDGRVECYFARPGYVPQNTAIFHGSLRDNITLGNECISTEHLRSVIGLCRLERLVTQIGGLDAEVCRERLSGGEAQRIGIARALAISPDLLVVDEITNNLDIANKAAVFGTLRALKGKCTIISIAHELDALGDSDFCWLLRSGYLHPIPGNGIQERRAEALRLIEPDYHV